MARQLAFTLPQPIKVGSQSELNAQFYREAEVVSLMLRATSWVFDPELLMLSACWETAWLPRPVGGVPDKTLALTIDIAALGHAVHAAIRPAALLPDKVLVEDPFAMALRRIEFESARMIQAQIIFLKGKDLLPYREAVSAAAASRHALVRRLWTEMLTGMGIAENKAG